MKLRRLRIDRLAGIGKGFELRDLAPGLNVVLGPNASGKSSLLRAVRALLYGEATSGACSLEAEFEYGQGLLRVVRQGRDVEWAKNGREIEPPDLPDSRLVSCFTIHVEQLLSPGGTEEAIRERVVRILAGGYDLESIRGAAPFCTGHRHGQRDEGELREAENTRTRALERQREIQAEEQEINALRAEKELASRSSARVAALRTALDLLATRRRVGSLERALTDFPAGMDKLVGDESGRLERLREALARRAGSLDEVAAEAARAKGKLDASGLTDSDLTLAALTEREQSLDALRALELERRAVEVAIEQAEARLTNAVRELGGTKPASSVRIDPQVVHDVEQGLGEKRRLDAEIRALDEQLALSDPTETDDATFERIRNARVELSQWLSAPEPAPGSARASRLWVLLLAATALAGVLTGALLLHWAMALLGLVVILACVPLLRPPAALDNRRREARRRFAETGVAEPTEWEQEPVRVRMAELDSEILAAERSRLDAERSLSLETKRDALRSREAEIARGLRTLAEAVGFDPIRLDGSFDRWLRLVHEYDEARCRHSERTGERRALSETEDRLRVDLLEHLGRFGEIPDDPSPGADIISGGLSRLRERAQQRDVALRDLDRAKVERLRAEREIAATKGEIGALYDRAGLETDDGPRLSSRLERLEQFKQVNDSLREERAVARDTEQRLGDEPALLKLLEQDDEKTLRAQLQQSEELAAGFEELARRVLDIENRIENAKRGHDLEEARALVANREETLRERLDEESFAVAADFLLGDVEREHVAVSRPPVLRRAEEWFAHFTNHAFVLDAPSGRNGQFLARDSSSGENRTLEQLSSGTRMQLLLALRLSFALEAERGREPLPIFLDEALTVADPERFRCVVGCIHDFARELDRQIFYLTAQPHDLPEWTNGGIEPKRIRLDEVRRIAAAVPRASELELPPAPVVPLSEGRTPAEYGIALGVPPISLWDEPDAIHLFHLLRDDLPLLERFLRRRILTVGQLRSLLDATAAPLLLTPGQIENLRFRTGAVPAFVEACRQGRGRPVDRAVLELAGVTETFLDRFCSLTEEQHGDGEALLQTIEDRRDERVKNFRAKQSEQLRSYFEEHGYVDSRPSLELEEIELLVLASLGPGIEDGTISREEATELTRFLAATALPRTVAG